MSHRLNRSVQRAAWLALALAPLSACDWRAFDDIADKTWVDTSSRPDGLKSKPYGIGLAFGGSGGSGVRILAASQAPAGFVRLSYDGTGKLTTTSSEVNQASAEEPIGSFDPRPATASDPGSYGEGQGSAAIGGNDESTVFVKIAKMDVAAPAMSSFNMFLPPVAGSGPIDIGFGKLNDGGDVDRAGGTDIVAATSEGLSVRPDYQGMAPGPDVPKAFTCTLEQATAMHVVQTDPDDGLILIGTATGTLTAHFAAEVVAAHVADAENLGRSPCGDGTPVPISASTAIPAIADGDFDGNGEIDVVLGEPGASGGGRLILLMNVGGGGGISETFVDAPAGAVSFGDVLAVGDFNDDGKDDLAVGDPGAASDGVVGSGAVYLYPGASGGLGAVTGTLFDASPEKDQAFGQALTSAAFDDAVDLLAVGAKDQIFVYFQNPLGGIDVRQ